LKFLKFAAKMIWKGGKMAQYKPENVEKNSEKTLTLSGSFV